MERLVFIDDDETELNEFRTIVGTAYNYETVQWPGDQPKLLSLSSPSIYVSDLYLPPPGPERIPTSAEKAEAEKAAKRVADRFSGLYRDPSWSDKRRLRETMMAIGCGRALLDQQWKDLGQSPDNGIALCRKVRQRHPHVPFVFYSRKITPEDVIDVLRAGAFDAIRKGLDPTEVLARLASARKFYARGDTGSLQTQGINVNVTTYVTQ